MKVDLEALRAFEAQFGNAGRALSRLVRPAICPPSGQKIISVDYSQIEARVLPWLAGSPGAEAKLDIFRETDVDPTAPDIYKRTAADTYSCRPEDVTKPQRQTGKVQELSLGFGGGKGALIAMAANYRLALTEAQAQPLVDAWRRNNAWAVDFWADLQLAFDKAYDRPMTPYSAGRVTYVYDPGYLRGTMFCELPCSRLISYPMLRYATVEKTDKFGKTESKTALTYMSQGRRRTLWKGILCVAGGALVATDRGWVRLDEVERGDRLWDGVEWVEHDGLIFKGEKDTLSIDDVRMTPDHEVLSHEGWRESAQCGGLVRPEVRMPDSYPAHGAAWKSSPVGAAVRLRADGDEGPRRLKEGDSERLHAERRPVRPGEDGGCPAYARDVEAPRFFGVAVDERPLQATLASGVAQLWRAGDTRVRRVGRVFRGVLGGHGADVQGRAVAGPDRQQRRVLAGELPLGNDEGTGGEPACVAPRGPAESARDNGRFVVDTGVPMETRAVYDIVNAGPRRRFVVLGSQGPMIVHNCENATQAAAGSLLRTKIKEAEAELPGLLIGHTHDELIGLADDAKAEQSAADLKALMERHLWWTGGLPIRADAEVQDWYSKVEA